MSKGGRRRPIGGVKESDAATQALKALAGVAVKTLVRRGAERLAATITSTPPLIEQVARRVFEEEFPTKDWDLLPEEQKTHRLRLARWHIEAVRDLVEGP